MKSLQGTRVLEFPDPETAQCGKLLAQMGAAVVLVEPPSELQSQGRLVEERYNLRHWTVMQSGRSGSEIAALVSREAVNPLGWRARA